MKVLDQESKLKINSSNYGLFVKRKIINNYNKETKESKFVVSGWDTKDLIRISNTCAITADLKKLSFVEYHKSIFAETVLISLMTIFLSIEPMVTGKSNYSGVVNVYQLIGLVVLIVVTMVSLNWLFCSPQEATVKFNE